MICFYHESMSKRGSGWEVNSRPFVTTLLDDTTWPPDRLLALAVLMTEYPDGITHTVPSRRFVALLPTVLGEAVVRCISRPMTKVPNSRKLSVTFEFPRYRCRAKICSAVTLSLSTGLNFDSRHLCTASAAHMSMSDSLMVQPLKSTKFVSQKLELFSKACDQITKHELYDLIGCVPGSQ